MSSGNCYHCGLANPKKPYFLDVFGHQQPFCCIGCQSAAKTILDSGLGEFYRFHEPNQQPVDVQLDEDSRLRLAIYDRTETLDQFSSEENDGIRVGILLIEGISCSACTWLIEKRLMQLDGVVEAKTNASTHRLTVRWRQQQTPLSEILKALILIGYQGIPFTANEEEQKRLREQRRYILRLGVAGVGMMQAMMNSVALYIGQIERAYELLLWWTSLVLTIPVMLISAWPFFKSGWNTIRHQQLTMDFSVSVAILSAFFASVYSTLTGYGHVYYESVNMFIFFLVLSRFLEFRARTYATGYGNRLAGLLPQSVRVVTETGSTIVPVSDLEAGGSIELLPGDVCPLDCVVTSGESEFDESSFTGEFRHIQKTVGDQLLAGTTNLSQPIIAKVPRSNTRNSFNLLQQLIERANSSKPRLAELADKGSKQFIWSTLVVATLIGLVWLWLDASRAFWIVISVLVVTCPCALSLATPTAFAQATASLKNRGFVITQGYALERLAALKEVAFDKTGTLTEGRFSVVNVESLDSRFSESDIRAFIKGLERHSEHPIAKAFQHWQETPATFSQVRALANRGIEGWLEDDHWFLGKPSSTLNADDKLTLIELTCNDKTVAIISLSDSIRSTVEKMFSELTSLGISTSVLTGDPNGSIKQHFTAVGLSGDYLSGCTPDDKVQWVENQSNAIAVVGDGVNDAPLLARAPLSIAMMDATDLTKTQADVLLLTNQLTILPEAIKKARKTRSIIHQNLLWALIYNVIALPLAAVGLVTPWMAAIGMSLSSLLVVGNATRLRG